MKKRYILLILVLLLALFAGCRKSPVPVQSSTASDGAARTESADTRGTGTSAAGTTAADPAADTTDRAGIHPMLFHVSDENGREAYLFGTIHVGDERIYTVLDKLTPYLDDCSALAVEYDVVAYESDYAAQMQGIQYFLLNDGTKASDHMPKELFEKVSALVSEAGLIPQLWEPYNLSWWSQLVEQAALMTRTDYDVETGMDRTLIRHCNDKKIQVRDVESANFQYGLLSSFSDELNLLMIRSTLENLDEYQAGIDELYNGWLEGDYDKLSILLTGEMDSEAEDMTEEERALMADYYDKLLTQRNLGMRDRAVEWLEAGDKVFFAVGAAHLVGEDGLVELLRAAGYTVEQLRY